MHKNIEIISIFFAVIIQNVMEGFINRCFVKKNE